jgi:glycosyltransferase involved in cell wall biosynthesis
MTGVAIVIPMLNEAAGLPRLLRSLAALEPAPAELLAVGGGSTDASIAIAEAGRAACHPARDPWPGGGDKPWRAGSHGTGHLRAARRHFGA